MVAETVIEFQTPARQEGGPPGSPFSLIRAPEEALAWLRKHRREIVEDWVERLSDLSPSYRLRPKHELFSTVNRATEANLQVLDSGRVELIDRFIDYITDKRLGAGFPLSDVQKAFELFRTVVIMRLSELGRFRLLALTVEPLNACLSYTILPLFRPFPAYARAVHPASRPKPGKGDRGPDRRTGRKRTPLQDPGPGDHRRLFHYPGGADRLCQSGLLPDAPGRAGGGRGA